MKTAVIQILIEGGYALDWKGDEILTTAIGGKSAACGTGYSTGVLIQDGAVWKRW